MKKILFMVLTAAIAFGCSKENDLGEGFTHDEVRITSGIATRASGTTWHNDDRVGIYMLQHSDKSVIKGNVRHKNTAADGTTATFEVVTPSEKLYYPLTGTVDFLAYYPYQSSVANYIYQVDVTSQTNLPAIDLMRASKANVGKTTDVQNLIFDHRLSNIKLTIKAGNGLTADEIKGVAVSIAGTSPKADYNLSTDMISNAEAAAAITIPQVEDLANAAQRVAEAIVIPQSDVSGVAFRFNVPGYGVFETRLPSTAALESGNRYLYTITISRTGATITSSSITGWTSNDNGSSTAEEVYQYKVGDYYPEPTNATTAIGVVFWVDETHASYNATNKTSEKGKIVSLDEGQGRWGANPYDESANEVMGIRSEDDGATATKNLITVRKDDTDFATTYYAFNWIYATKNSRYVDGRWYLPARKELESLYAAWNGDRTGFNAKLTTASGTAISADVYWSSTEVDGYSVWLAFFDFGGTDLNHKGSDSRVRGVSAF